MPSTATLDQLADPEHKFSREDIGYRDGTVKCMRCTNFNYIDHSCVLLDDVVSPTGSCDEFDGIDLDDSGMYGEGSDDDLESGDEPTDGSADEPEPTDNADEELAEGNLDGIPQPAPGTPETQDERREDNEIRTMPPRTSNSIR